MWADLVNASFELFGGFFVFLHCLKVMKDKEVKGVSIISVVFFTLWGVWNLYYYPSLGQFYSFLGGLFIVAANTMWVFLLIKYYKPVKIDSNVRVAQ